MGLDTSQLSQAAGGVYLLLLGTVALTRMLGWRQRWGQGREKSLVSVPDLLEKEVWPRTPKVYSTGHVGDYLCFWKVSKTEATCGLPWPLWVSVEPHTLPEVGLCLSALK